MAEYATGRFGVTLTPQAQENSVGDPSVGRLSLEKQYYGDLDAVSKGQMLAVRTEIEGSAGYVAMERVTGSLNGRSGSFALQHNGVMARGAQQLSIIIVPDSGTEELRGISGKMTIRIGNGEHSYSLEYTLS